MSQFSKLSSLLVGLGCGGVFGVYLAQNYNLPDLHAVAERLFSKTNEYKKDDKN